MSSEEFNDEIENNHSFKFIPFYIKQIRGVSNE
jgi:hypothetical protein